MFPVISSYALLTAFGDAERTWSALLEGRCLPESSRIAMPAGGRHRRVTSLALHVAREALSAAPEAGPSFAQPAAAAPISWHGLPARGVGIPTHPVLHDTALIVGTSKGEIDAWLSATTASGRPESAARMPPPCSDTSSLPGTMDTPRAGRLDPAGLAEISAALASELGIGGPVLTVSAACASGLVALVRGLLMLRAGEAARVLVVAAESSFHPLLLASYRRLGVLADPAAGCRPFDRERTGFVLGEAAAAVLLEHGGDGLCVADFAIGGDAVSITAADPSGTVLRGLIRRSIGGRGIDLVHAHGTGTVLNDPIELAAIDAALSPFGPVPVYSHKCSLGHTLGASGLVSVVLNCLAHGRGLIPPNSHTPNPLPSRCGIISSTPLSRRIGRSTVIAAGFGGPAATVTLQARSRF